MIINKINFCFFYSRILIILFLLIFLNININALPEQSLHINVQVTDGIGNIQPFGTHDFHFNLSDSALCETGLYNKSFLSQKTDARGIASFYLDNIQDVNFKQQLYICYIRDGIIQNISLIARVPYSQTAGTLLNETNLDLTNFNITADTFIGRLFKGLFEWVINDNSLNFLTFNKSTLTLTNNATQWFYNQTTATYNLYGQWWYNQTTPAISYTDSVVSANNASWSSTFNKSYITGNIFNQWLNTSNSPTFKGLTLNFTAIRQAVMWYSLYDSRAFYLNTIPAYTDTLYHGTKRNITITVNRNPSSGSLSDLFTLTNSQVLWNNVNSTNPVNINITYPNPLYINQLDIIFSWRNRQAINYSIKTVDDSNDDGIFTETLRHNIFNNVDYVKSHPINLWRVKSILININASGDSDLAGSLSIGTIQAPSAIHGKGTGTLADVGGDTFYGNILTSSGINISTGTNGWFKGLFNWIINPSSLNFLSFNGSTLTLTNNATQWFYNQTTPAVSSANAYTDTASTNLQTNISNVNTTLYDWVLSNFVKLGQILNIAYTNQTNIFTKQQEFIGGVNISGNISLDDGVITRTGTNTTIGINSNGTLVIHFG